MAHSERVVEVLGEAKRLAQEYRALTGRPLGVTGEVAEHEAARILGFELMPARWAGHDAVGPDGRRYQIKGRCLLPGCKPGQRVGSIDICKEFDAVLLVLLDADLDATEIHEADRGAIVEALIRPGSRARNERGALSVSAFKRIGRPVWRRPDRAAQPVGPMSGLDG